eukprot:CAMPEP_0206452292 /NCGR_PEP_ID=MMETSP0324_2-20121206/19862_1 /ASSEMBLY_ACC=CAM_ASM_000836 /TAXON_ID=2866 /ORGANISM="Crypthecodinium cohnii, Strain Seligo" /LENGTH=498 /DNA_ID=CAMNT_0053922361 /DNA_START=203 /DNA_END=1699 /DNA_ORIENTATION=+
MPSMKRPAAASASASAGSSAKKQKTSAIKKKIDAVVKAILKGGSVYPEDVVAMLGTALPNALSVFQAERHYSQEEVVKMGKKVLEATIAAKEASISEARTTLEEVQAALSSKEAAHEAAKQVLSEKAALETTAKEEVQVAATTAAGLKEAYDDALAEQKNGDQTYNEVELEKSILEAAHQKDFAAVRDGTSEDSTTTAKALLKLATQKHFESQLLESAEKALVKSLADRGAFDKVVLDQFENELISRIKAIDERLKELSVGKNTRQSKVDAVKVEYDNISGVPEAKQAALSAALEAKKEATEAVKAAKSEIEELRPACKAATTANNSLAVELASLQETLTTFCELETLAPAPEPPADPPAEDQAEAAEAAEGEGEAAAEEAAVAAEAEAEAEALNKSLPAMPLIDGILAAASKADVRGSAQPDLHRQRRGMDAQGPTQGGSVPRKKAARWGIKPGGGGTALQGAAVVENSPAETTSDVSCSNLVHVQTGPVGTVSRRL